MRTRSFIYYDSGCKHIAFEFLAHVSDLRAACTYRKCVSYYCAKSVFISVFSFKKVFDISTFVRSRLTFSFRSFFFIFFHKGLLKNLYVIGGRNNRK